MQHVWQHSSMELKLATSVSVKQHHWNVTFHVPRLLFNTKTPVILADCKLDFGLRSLTLTIVVRKRHSYNIFVTANNALCRSINAFSLSTDSVADDAAIAKHYRRYCCIFLSFVFVDVF